MRVLYLMTARGGSKRIPGKNMRTLNGLSLVGFKANAARRSRYCSRLIISSDCPEIQAEAARFGAEVPFTRPAELATDRASSSDVILHAMDWVERNSAERYEALMLLEPSTPFTRARDLDAAVEVMAEKEANVVVGVREMEVNSVFVGPLDRQGRITRIVEQMNASGQRSFLGQDFPTEYTMNGALYLAKWGYFKAAKSFYKDAEKSYGYVMDRLHSIEIDDPVDLMWAEFLVERGLVDFSEWAPATRHEAPAAPAGLSVA
jgi:N-acylneuraminate cytidylyltransferase/CMP-N,N'-diacetyllegionaminic acid synthase